MILTDPYPSVGFALPDPPDGSEYAILISLFLLPLMVKWSYRLFRKSYLTIPRVTKTSIPIDMTLIELSDNPVYCPYCGDEDLKCGCQLRRNPDSYRYCRLCGRFLQNGMCTHGEPNENALH